MEEKDLIYPYYETTYLDDNNDKHIAYLQDDKTVSFYKERYTVLNSEYKEEDFYD